MATDGRTDRNTRPIFISSTFKDMQAERDYLRTHVFPRLQDRLNDRRCYLERIDLRQGAVDTATTDEETRELRILRVCLDEIEASRPYMIVLLGDRYGYVPPAERLLDAAAGADFEIDPTDLSITAMEIEYGLAREEEHDSRRCFFFFRKPIDWQRLPEDRRADYCDAHADDEQVRSRQARLRQLQQRMADDPELAGRVHWYAADWDDEEGMVTGLDEFGQVVIDAIWPVLDADTRDLVRVEPPDWLAREVALQDAFFSERLTDHVAREATESQVVAFARTAGSDRPPWALIITGAEGAGKSTLAAVLCREIIASPDHLLLSHSAGISPTSRSEHRLLAKWIRQLQRFLGEPEIEPEAGGAGTDLFYDLLSRASARSRVVVVLDALNDLERTDDDQRLFCLDAERWPAAARLVATATELFPGDRIDDLPRSLVMGMSPLALDEATAVATGVWRRHHRQPPLQVVTQLVAKSLAGRDELRGNPLWLVLAAESLNNLDAEQYQRAHTEHDGTAAQQIESLMLELVDGMPRDVPGLYMQQFARAERAFGIADVRGFLTLLCAGRSGWRNRDLDHLFPRMIALPDAARDPDLVGRTVMANALTRFDSDYRFQEELSPSTSLRVAELRCFFLPDLAFRGSRQFDFRHRACRNAAARHLALDDADWTVVHRVVAAYLVAQRPDDPVRCDEVGHHLLAAGEQAWLQIGYGSTHTTCEREIDATTEMLLTVIRTRGMAAFLSLTAGDVDVRFAGPDGNDPVPGHIRDDLLRDIARGWVSRCIDELLPRIRYTVPQQDQLTLLEVLEQQLASAYAGRTDDPACRALQDQLTRRIAALRQAQHQFEEARALIDPTHASDQGDYEQLLSRGDLELHTGNLEAARACYQRALASLGEGDDRSRRLRDLGVIHDKLGDVAKLQRDHGLARKHYDQALPALRSLAEREPEGRRDVALCLAKLGDLELAERRLDAARKAFKEYHDIVAARAEAAPGDAERQRDLAGAHGRLQGLAQHAGDAAAAMQHARVQIEILERLVATCSTNANWNQDLAGVRYMYGMALHERGDDRTAATYLEQSASAVVAMHDAGQLDHKGRHLVLGLFNVMSEFANGDETLQIGVRAVRVARSYPDPEVRDTILKRALDYASRLLDSERNDAARTICDALREATASDDGTASLDHLCTLNLLGIISKRRGDLADAETLYRQVHDGMRLLLGNDHQATLAAKRNLDWVQERRGRS